MQNEPGKELTTQNLGDTIHMWAVREAIARQQHASEKGHQALPMYVDAQFARLFVGSTVRVISHRHTSIFFSRGMPWVGPKNGQHVRDTFKFLLNLPGLNLKVRMEAKNMVIDQPYVVLCPTASRSYKLWGKDQWLEVMEHLRKDFQIILNDNFIFKDEELPSGVFKCWTSPETLACALKCAELVVGVDSGPLHLADALDNPPVGLYGATSTMTYGPYIERGFCVDQHRQAWNSKDPYNSAFHLNHGMDLITTDMAIAAINTRLAHKRTPA